MITTDENKILQKKTIETYCDKYKITGEQRKVLFLLSVDREMWRIEGLAELAELKEPKTTHILNTVLIVDPSEKVRAITASVLGVLRDKASIPFLKATILYDNSFFAGIRATKALTEFTDPSIIPFFTNILLHNPKLERRFRAIEGLRAIKTEPTTDILRALEKAFLDDPSEDIRETAAKMLGDIGDKHTLLTLISHTVTKNLQEPSKDVQKAALLAAHKIAKRLNLSQERDNIENRIKKNNI